MSSWGDTLFGPQGLLIMLIQDFTGACAGGGNEYAFTQPAGIELGLAWLKRPKRAVALALHFH